MGMVSTVEDRNKWPAYSTNRPARRYQSDIIDDLKAEGKLIITEEGKGVSAESMQEFITLEKAIAFYETTEVLGLDQLYKQTAEWLRLYLRNKTKMREDTRVEVQAGEFESS